VLVYGNDDGLLIAKGVPEFGGIVGIVLAHEAIPQTPTSTLVVMLILLLVLLRIIYYVLRLPCTSRQ
jgi:hypothetical protein